MKNLYLFAFILSLVGATQADMLSDAIFESDVETVRVALSKSTFTRVEMIKYLDRAEHIIRMRWDDIVLEREGRIEECSDRDFYFGVISFLTCPISLCVALKTQQAWAAYTAMASFGGILICLSALESKLAESRVVLHRDSMTIKEMLYDHWSSLLAAEKEASQQREVVDCDLPSIKEMPYEYIVLDDLE